MSDTMNIFALEGHKVRLKTLNAGYDFDKELIKEHLELREIYTVDYTVVHNSSTDVYLKEVPAIPFNSVFFEDLDPQSPEDDQKHPHYNLYN